VIVGYGRSILTSSDGITWAIQASQTTYTLLNITYLKKLFFAVGETGTISVVQRVLAGRK
jgi:hypothetical protein